MSLVQALVTALLSGLFSGAIMFALNERRDRHNLILTKIEGAIEAYVEWTETISLWPNAHFNIFIEDDRQAARKALDSSYWEARKIELKARVLQEIYLPDQREAFDAVIASYHGFIDESRTIKVASIAGGPMPTDGNNAIGVTSVAMVQAAAEGRAMLFDAARKHAHAPHLVRLPKLSLRFLKNPA